MTAVSLFTLQHDSRDVTWTHSIGFCGAYPVDSDLAISTAGIRLCGYSAHHYDIAYLNKVTPGLASIHRPGY